MDPAVKIIPVSAVVPTANRSVILQITLESVAQQSVQPAEIIIIDASEDELTMQLCEKSIPGLSSVIRYEKAKQKGAASQRNQAVDIALNDVIFFFDDDIRMQEACVERIWTCLQSDTNIGAVNAMIINQRYHSPGKVTRFMYRVLSGVNLRSYAGKCIGPAWNLLPEDDESLPECNQVEWLNTTCTMYKKQALPFPVFQSHFKGYSLLEDVALSLTVGKKWKLFNARTARIYHDSQPGTHKNSVYQLSKMELINRYYVMRHVLNRAGFVNYCKLFLFEAFGIFSTATSVNGIKNILPNSFGKLAAFVTLLFTKTSS